jgi:hypothetical protein
METPGILDKPWGRRSSSTRFYCFTPPTNMPTNRFEPSTIKNKVKREEIARKQKREKRQSKLQRRLALAKAESDNPAAKKVSGLYYVSLMIPNVVYIETSA